MRPGARRIGSVVLAAMILTACSTAHPRRSETETLARGSVGAYAKRITETEDGVLVTLEDGRELRFASRAEFARFMRSNARQGTHAKSP
ncbi:MAG: hypothetical protein HYZ89_03660 [Candidatus Omnitrophica bacterium]|nr:hypothetical protein [Candidatus Omnitrophota bacterium]